MQQLNNIEYYSETISALPPQITADVISFLVGGFHTSGYMITWLLWYLADNPQSQVTSPLNYNFCCSVVVKTQGLEYKFF